MGADASVDELRISIEAKAASARTELSGLASDVGKLKDSVGGAASALDRLASSLSSLHVGQSTVNTIKGIANAVQTLNGVKISSTIGRQLDAISSAAASATGAGNVRQLGEAAQFLAQTRISSSIGNQLKKVAEGAQALNQANVDSSKVRELANSLNALSSIQPSSISSTVNALRRLPEAAQALHAVDFRQMGDDARRLTNALGGLPAKLGAVRTSYAGVGGAARSASGGVDSLSSATQRHSASLADSVRNTASFISNVRRIAMVAGAVGAAWAGLITSANNYIEDMNLVNVALGQYTSQAREYADRVYEVLGIAPQDFLRTQGTFATMAQGMGIASDKAYVMSQQLTQLSQDLASFYNLSTEEATEKVQAGLAGQIRPLRELGYDLSEAKLKEEAMALGIDENVESMTQAEKAMLRYHAMLSQVSWAQGDMARTLDSPANALRVFKSNVANAAKSIGSIFLPMIRAILPVATAAAKVVATLANMLANLTGGSQIASVDYSGGGVSSPGGAGAGDGIDTPSSGGGGGSPTAKKYKGIGDAAKDAAEDVKALKREVMGFDEINKFSPESAKSPKGPRSGGNGGGGRGGAGGAGGGGGGAGNIPVQTYDFLGSGKALGDGLFNAIMDAVKRAAKAFLPLVDACKAIIDKIKGQFYGLDIAGAAENALMGFLNLVSNVARNVVEIVGPMMVALNIPETVAVGFDLTAQACLTLSAGINALGSMVQGFTDVAIVPLVAWIGDKLRGAMFVLIDVLRSWQDWFMRNTEALAALGRAAGVGAGLVLTLARAIADQAFDVATSVFKALNSALQGLLEMLVNSAAARAAATLLGGALAVFGIGGGIAMGLNAVATVFNAMASVIVEKAIAAHDATHTLAGTLSGPLGVAADNVSVSLSNLGFALDELGMASGASAALDRFETSAGSARDAVADLAMKAAYSRQSIDEFSNGTRKANDVTVAARRHYDSLKSGLDGTRDALAKAKSAVQDESQKLSALSEKHKEATLSGRVLSSETNHLALMQQKLSVWQAQLSQRIEMHKAKLLQAKIATSAYATAEERAAVAEGKVVLTKSKAAVAIALDTAAKGAMTLATNLATAAQLALDAAASAFPGMILMLALQGIMTVLGPLIDKVGKFVMGLLGLNDETGEVSDTTKEANQVLSEEEQQVQRNVESIKAYEQGHDNLRDALEASNVKIDDWARHLQETGQTFDDLKQKQDSFTDSTINSFDKIDQSSSMSLDELVDNLNENAEMQREWSEDMQRLMEATGRGANDAMIQGLMSAGPGKMKQAVEEALSDPSGEELERLKEAFSNAGSTLAPEVANSIKEEELTNKVRAMGIHAVDAYSGGVSESSGTAEAASQDVDDATVQKFGSHYNEAKDAGRNLAGGFGDGVREASADAAQPAAEVSAAAVQALNGGNGYAAAADAGRNLVGGFGDGISQAAGGAVSASQGVRQQAVQALNGGRGYNEAKDAGRNLLGGYGDGIGSVTGSVVSQANGIRQRVVQSLNGGSGTSAARSAGSQMMGGFTSGLSSGIGGAQGAGRRASEAAQQGMGSNYWGANSAGRNEMGGFIDGLSSASGSAWNAGRGAAESAQNGAGSNYWGAYDAGRNFGYGFGDGIGSTWSHVYWTAYNLAADAAEAARRAVDVRSPSRVMRKVGAFFGQGYALGIESERPDVMSSASKLALASAAAVGDARRAGEGIAKAFRDGIRSVDAPKLAAEASEVEAQVRASIATGSWNPAGQRRPKADVPHVRRLAPTDDGTATDVLAQAVERGMLSVVMGTSGASGTGNHGDTQVVLRVGNEELARATIKGQESLARRGLLRFD
nr:hypothetical protein [uncultured Olsenella sp.]